MNKPEPVRRNQPPRSEAAYPKPPRKEDVEKMRRLSGKNDERPPSSCEAGGDRIAELFRQASQTVAAANDAAPTPEAAPASGVERSRCAELVERILVSRPSADGREEVRIQVNRSWLPDTEVRVTRTPEAGLSVEFLTDAAESQRFLLPNLAGLRERLAERTAAPVAVRMTESAEDSPDGGQKGGQNGGRGRNRRNIYYEEIDRL